MFNDPLFFGTYPAYVTFQPKTRYRACESQLINIRIDTPTVLTLTIVKTEVVIREEITLEGSLKSEIDDSSLSNKTIEIFLNTKKIGVTATDLAGVYTYVVSTNDLREGVYNVSTRFTSDANVWRSAASRVIQLNIVLGFLQTFTVIALMAVVLLSMVFMLVFRKKFVGVFKKEHPVSLQTSMEVSPAASRSRLEQIPYDEKDFVVDTATGEPSTFKEAIATRYRRLVNFLCARGLSCTPSSTHLDIRRTMVDGGFPKDATETIAQVFEIAQYSSYPIHKKDVALFNKRVVEILKKMWG